MSWDKSIGTLSIKIRVSVQFLTAGRDIRVPLYCAIVLRLRRALRFPLNSYSFDPLEISEYNNLKQKIAFLLTHKSKFDIYRI